MTLRLESYPPITIVGQDGNPYTAVHYPPTDNGTRLQMTLEHRPLEKNWRTAGTRTFVLAKPLKYWRSLGETADDFRNADKSEGNRITCTLSDTTCVYHRQSSGAVE
jgi:hypothetical protein